ncbi:MAG: CoA transferase [Gammaproteobacteria bacterium]|jgi:crotonobetainyl-CoA:carnitine CoA-transferase CaiB-like acyl-CoA transferase|nr:CoA transferase [Gammaproteobacteria bacterium]MBT4492295.1 CoA transferase [Gammaproteobacteria bacterium]MBT7369436.1 CoA transferase [Gammaproteobacteria bacterium]
MPLAGYTVLDLTIARAGPTAVRLLADWGANVIRIEPPPSVVGSGLTGGNDNPDSQNLHRNKRGLTINLKNESGLALFLKLVGKADIVVENFRKDVKHRLGIDYESLRKVNPAIIYGSISGYGQEGPYSERPAVDQVIQGMSGLMSITGSPGDGPMRAGVAISDTSAGMFLGQGILLALLHREKTGEGQWVHTSLLEAMLSKLDFQGARYTMDGEVPGQEGNNHPTNAPMGVFESADGLVNLAASTNKMFRAFTAAVGHPELVEDDRFSSSKARFEHRQAVWESVNSITREIPTHELVEIANEAGCPCGPIYDIGQAFEDEHVRYLKMARTAPHKTRGGVDLVRSPINMSVFPQEGEFDRSGPAPGEHTDEILLELGFNEKEIAGLRTSGAI